jgi:hypothetical protein
MTLKDTLFLIYCAVGIVVMIWTWLDNQQVCYVMGEPPSPFWSGVCWPLGALMIVGCFLWWPIEQVIRFLVKGNPDD